MNPYAKLNNTKLHAACKSSQTCKPSKQQQQHAWNHHNINSKCNEINSSNKSSNRKHFANNRYIEKISGTKRISITFTSTRIINQVSYHARQTGKQTIATSKIIQVSTNESKRSFSEPSQVYQIHYDASPQHRLRNTTPLSLSCGQ